MEYSIIYMKRKSVGIRIENGGIVVKAPFGVSREFIEKTLDKHKEWIARAIEREKQRRESGTVTDESEIRRLKSEAKEYFAEKCPEYAEIMGVDYTRINVTSAKTRFGSCSSKGSISFSYLLMLYPEAAREYVIVHELAHRIEMNHSPRFYAVIERYMPDYKKRRELLKNNLIEQNK